MRKQAGVFLLALTLVTGVGVPAQTETAETQPKARAGKQAQEKPAAKKYPPYPDVWGYELPWPSEDSRRAGFHIAKLPMGDYFVTHIKSLKKTLMKDGTCCDFDYEFAGFSFFSGTKKDLPGEEYNTFWKQNSKSRIDRNWEKIVFKDGTRIEQKSELVGHCESLLPFSLVKFSPEGSVVLRKMVLYRLDHPRRRELYGGGCSDPEKTIEEKVEAVFSKFVLLEDETFLLYDAGGNFIVRFDKDFNTKFLLTDRIFAVDADIIDKIKNAKPYEEQRIQDAVFRYLQDLKRSTSR